MRTGTLETSVDTAEGAAHLTSFYEARGYREVEHVKWTQTNYLSVVLSKTVSGATS